MKKTILTLLGLASASMLSAQIYVFENEILNTTGVSNEGVAIGYGTSGGTPFYLWDAVNNEIKEIGGAAPGDGIGGVGRITGNGRFAIGAAQSDKIPVSAEWITFDYPNFNGYNFKKIVYMSDYNVFAIGEDAEGTRGVSLKTVNNGNTWMVSDDVVDSKDGSRVPRPILCGSVTGRYLFFGAEGRLYYTSGNGSLFEKFPVVNGETVESADYNAVDFLDGTGKVHYWGINSVLGVKTTDGKGQVWYSNDETDNYNVATGVDGIPLCITHVDNVYWMGTSTGAIQFSIDLGKTWQTAYTLPAGTSVTDITFRDDTYGLVLSGDKVYMTSDGGAEWKRVETEQVGINPFADGFTWNDVMYLGDVITIVGNDGRIVRSSDNGKSFKDLTLPGNTKANLGAVYCFNNIYNVLGNGGVFYRKSEVADVTGYAASIYDVEKDEWTPLATLGYDLQDNYSSCYGMSDNAAYVAGIIRDLYKPTNMPQAYAGVWDVNAGTVTKLPKMFESENKSARANAVSFDGSVVAGWQDMFGPWFGSVWRRGADGTYTQSLMYADEADRDKNIDFMNDKLTAINALLGYCQCVSEDGKWIAGNGAIESATQAPWIWNEENGLTVIGSKGNTGCVADIANDGSMAIGWWGTGQGAWIWTKELGLMDLQTYASDVLNVKFDGFGIVSVYDMSANGRYVTGWGFEGDQPRAYVLDMKPVNTGIFDVATEQVKAAVYPNPVSTELHIDVPYGNGEIATSMTLTDMSGRTVMRRSLETASNSVSVESLPAGMYLLRVEAGTNSKTFKVVVRH